DDALDEQGAWIIRQDFRPGISSICSGKYTETTSAIRAVPRKDRLPHSDDMHSPVRCAFVGQGEGMKRRNVLKLAGGAAAWPLLARAQQAKTVIGVLSARSPEESAGLLEALRHGLTENGITEGQNAAIEYRWALGEYGR